ncbi:MAG: hypothetical protein ACUVXD_00055 [Thermodesulfobacteriota bacterium]
MKQHTVSLQSQGLPKVALVLPNAMAVRNFVETPVLGLLAERRDLMAVILTNSQEDKDRISHQGAGYLQWADLRHPTSNRDTSDLAMRVRRLAHKAVARVILRGKAEFGNLVFRFNHLEGFVGHRQKSRLPAERRLREATAGNYVDERLGRPWAGSPTMYGLLYNLYYSNWYSAPTVEAFFDEFCPDLLVLGHVQNEGIRPYVAAARRRKIPILGIVGSWDQLTTKGPICPGLERLVVQSQVMRGELVRYHHVPDERIEVTGWPQMDYYMQEGVMLPRDVFLRSLGLPAERRLLLFGANTPRLGPHEPGIASYLATGVAKNRYGRPCSLVIRPHPRDRDWTARFGGLHDPPHVLVQASEMGRLQHLANLLQHADVLVASSGSICLDAVALDTCVVNLAFDGDLRVDHFESVRRWYEMEHFAAVVRTGGTRLVEGYDELDSAIVTYLNDPDTDTEGRKRLRQEQLEPLDGHASDRLVSVILREAVKAASRRSERASTESNQ